MSHEDEQSTPIPSEAPLFGGETDTEDMIPVPRYESEQYLPKADHITGARKDILIREFGLIRTYFKSRPEKHFSLQRKLNQARMGISFDQYLTRSVWYSFGAGLAGAVVGLAVSLLFAQAGIFEGIRPPVAPSMEGPIGGLIQVLSANKTLIGGGILTMGFAMLFSAGVWFGRYYYPHVLVDTRRRNINITLPHAIVYMYALAYGGMDFTEVLRRTADTEDTYGEVANEFDMIVRDMELFGNDLYTALRNTRNLTPSENMEQFIDDMLSVLDAGGNIAEFLRDESDRYMDEAVREQESFLDTLEMMSEVFVVGFVAAPLFLVVTLLMMSFLGENTLPMLFVLVYAVLPLGMLAFLVMIATFSEPYRQPTHDFETTVREPNRDPSPELAELLGYKMFRRIRFGEEVRSLLGRPTAVFRKQPLYTLGVTLPVAGLLAGIMWARLGGTLELFFTRPLTAGLGVAVLPFLIVAVPLSLFHELDEHRKRHIAKRLPDTLDILASANQMGVSLDEGLEMVSRNITGAFADELVKVRNDIHWNADVQQALRSLADRVDVPQLTRTCNILAEGTRSTGELYKILSIAAEDTRQRYRLERNRREELKAYTTVVVIGFLVYLGVIVIIDYSFLGAIGNSLEGSASTADAGIININLDQLTTYHAIFFHSALIMAVGTGLISGKLTDNSELSGLKYSILLVVLTVLIFLFI